MNNIVRFCTLSLYNETKVVQLEKERPENLKCNRSSEKYEIQWRKVEIKRKKLIVLIVLQLDFIQNGELYSGDIYVDSNSSAVRLQGSADEIGNYTCHWNNSLGEARFKQFTVTYVGEKERETIVVTRTDTKIVVALSVALAILLLISIVVGTKYYVFKVKKKLEIKSIINEHNLTKQNHLKKGQVLLEEGLPYDKRWEFPRHRLKLGSCFVQVGYFTFVQP